MPRSRPSPSAVRFCRSTRRTRAASRRSVSSGDRNPAMAASATTDRDRPAPARTASGRPSGRARVGLEIDRQMLLGHVRAPRLAWIEGGLTGPRRKRAVMPSKVSAQRASSSSARGGSGSRPASAVHSGRLVSGPRARPPSSAAVADPRFGGSGAAGARGRTNHRAAGRRLGADRPPLPGRAGADLRNSGPCAPSTARSQRPARAPRRAAAA
jgi:hypothetical protein